MVLARVRGVELMDLNDGEGPVPIPELHMPILGVIGQWLGLKEDRNKSSGEKYLELCEYAPDKLLERLARRARKYGIPFRKRGWITNNTYYLAES